MFEEDRLADRVAAYLRDVILKSNLHPGDRLPGEAEISRVLGISRPVVREATRAMAASGLVEVAAGRAPRVGEVRGRIMQTVFENALLTGQADARQVLEVRRGLEISMAALAAERRDEDSVHRLEALGQRMGAALQDAYTYVELDVQFHREIAAATENIFYVVLIDGCRAALVASMEAGLRHRFTQAELDRVQAAHLEIVAAIRDRDPAAAASAMTRHFDDALTALYRSAQVGTA
jgi:GntR family transcriptional regulator, transcriptional repressor for pyruvate dehydrogenase complex